MTCGSAKLGNFNRPNTTKKLSRFEYLPVQGRGDALNQFSAINICLQGLFYTICSAEKRQAYNLPLASDNS